MQNYWPKKSEWIWLTTSLWFTSWLRSRIDSSNQGFDNFLIVPQKRLEAYKTFHRTVAEDKPIDKSQTQSIDSKDHDTVGAVAVDGEGNCAVATSTGGLTAQRVGRVGDSPIIGAGGYADNTCGAVSTTGQLTIKGFDSLKVTLISRTWRGDYADVFGPTCDV